MKNFLITCLLALLSACSTDRVEENCECFREDWELTFTIVDNTTFWNEELVDRYPVVCQEERERVFFYESGQIRRYYNIDCNGI